MGAEVCLFWSPGAQASLGVLWPLAAFLPVFQCQLDKSLLILDLQAQRSGFASRASRGPPTTRTAT